MAYDALEVVKNRNDFYKDSYHKLVLILFTAILAIIGLVVAIVFLVMSRPSPTYFATTDSGRMIPLIPLNQPNLSDKALLQWTSQAVVSVYSYNFVNFREIFQNNEKYFTNDGWQEFLNALKASRNLETVKDKKLIVSAVLSGAPIISSKNVFNGRYTWQIQMPVLVTYQSMSEQFNSSYLITLTIQRVSTLDNIYGVGISSFVVQENVQ